MSNFYFKILVFLSLISTGWAYSCYVECGAAFTRLQQLDEETNANLRYMASKLDYLGIEVMEAQKCKLY